MDFGDWMYNNVLNVKVTGLCKLTVEQMFLLLRGFAFQGPILN